MNENIDLTKILKDCPKGTKLYSIVHGDVKFGGFTWSELYPILIRIDDSRTESFSADGKMYHDCGECALFPSKDQRDWNKFTAPWLKKEGYALKSFKYEDVLKFMKYIEKEAKAYGFKLPNRGYDIYAFAKDLLVWLEKQGEQTNERAWLYLVSDVLTWKDGIGQYLDDPRVQELAKRLCSKYEQKLFI